MAEEFVDDKEVGDETFTLSPSLSCGFDLSLNKSSSNELDSSSGVSGITSVKGSSGYLIIIK